MSRWGKNRPPPSGKGTSEPNASRASGSAFGETTVEKVNKISPTTLVTRPATEWFSRGSERERRELDIINEIKEKSERFIRERRQWFERGKISDGDWQPLRFGNRYEQPAAPFDIRGNRNDEQLPAGDWQLPPVPLPFGNPYEQLPAALFDIPSERAPMERPRAWKNLHAVTIKEAVQYITPYLEDTSQPSQHIYFDGWTGLGASAVLTSIAKDPPPSVRNKFDKIIHIDCSKWKNRRELQRKIAQKLALPQHVMDILDKQDEQDDFNGADEGARIEITVVGREIHQALQGQSCLVIFHNGSTNMVDLNDFGIPQPADRWSNFFRKVLWTFRGRLHSIPGMKPAADPTHAPSISSAESTKPSSGNQSQIDQEEFSTEKVPATEGAEVDKSQVYLYSYLEDSESEHWNGLVHEEATEIVQYTRNKQHGVVTSPETAALCCKYMLLLNSKGVDKLDFNWDTHASNYWVCDGIIQEPEQNKAWEVATGLLEEMKLEDFSSYRLPDFGDKTRWVVATDSDMAEEIKPETTSFFWVNRRRRVASLPSKIFQRSDEQLHVLKLCLCTFSFSSPPFLQCQNIRFLGLDKCKDQPKKHEESKQGKEDRRKNMFFQTLWVLDICDTDWELDLSPDIIESMLKNIREINIKRGRIWSNNYAWTWRHAQNIHKLRVIEPTLHWKDEGKQDDERKDEFMNMSKLELLDLSGNSTIQALPRLSGATSLSTLVLDGCVGLTTVAALPPSLETFSFDAGEGKHDNKKAKISRISMADCARLVNFRLRGYLLNLEELDLSNTLVKTLNLKDEVVQVPFLQRLILLGCEQIRAILWPKAGMPKLVVLRIDTREVTKQARTKAPHDVDYSLVSSKEHEEMCHARVAVTDLRLLQLLLLAGSNKFCWNTVRFNLNLYLASASKDTGRPYNTRRSVASPQHKSPVLKSHRIYSDINIDEATGNHDGSSAKQFQPLDFHLEIGEEISSANVVTEQAIRAVRLVLNKVNSLQVHDSFSVNTIISGSMVTHESWSGLKLCSIERCPDLNTVFTTDDVFCFPELETFWGAHLLNARCIWSKGWIALPYVGKLQTINLHLCPRLTFVLPLSWSRILSSLETLRIICCGDLNQVFPAEAEFVMETSTGHPRGELELPNLKHIYLHDLPKLHQICEVKMFAPKLETIWVRGCWSLKRIPATTDRPDSRPVVDCEKDWWNKLEWDGKKARHHPSLFELRQSKYYKKTLLRSSVLR